MSSFLPRISNLHLNVTDLEDEDILSHIDVAVGFIREAVDNGGNVLVHCFRQVLLLHSPRHHGYK